jgi:hypothetical protein
MCMTHALSVLFRLPLERRVHGTFFTSGPRCIGYLARAVLGPCLVMTVVVIRFRCLPILLARGIEAW